MIKEVTIINFKSYLYQKIVLDKARTHLILGKNGQGKSNFYSALEFLLKRGRSVMSPQEKRSILHESLENDDVSVEAFIDNRNSRFPVETTRPLTNRSRPRNFASKKL